MVAVETAVVERNGHMNGHLFEPFEHHKAPEMAPVKEQVGVQPRPIDSAPVSSEHVAEMPPPAKPPAGTAAKARPSGKKASKPAPSSAKPASPNAAERAQTDGPRVKYVSEAALRAEQKKLEKLSTAALAGDTTALDKLRAELDHCPHIWQRLGDLQIIIERKLVGLVAGTDPLKAEAFRKRSSQLRHDLLDGEPCSLATEMAASRLVATFMFVQMLELRALESPAELRCIKQLVQAERRCQVAMRTFLMARHWEHQRARSGQ